jgi:hypothetical protein
MRLFQFQLFQPCTGLREDLSGNHGNKDMGTAQPELA